MAFNVQNDDGTIDGANSYVDAATVRAYWTDRGVDLSSRTDDELQVAAIKATDYLDARYTFVGYQLRRLQGTQWPRSGTPGTDWPYGVGPQYLRGLPPALINATCSLTTRALSGKSLMPDPTYDASGQRVSESSVKVGPIEKSLKFSQDGKSPADATPEFPEVTLMLKAAGLVSSGLSGRLSRA